jgi:hypothetical protein
MKAALVEIVEILVSGKGDVRYTVTHPRKNDIFWTGGLGGKCSLCLGDVTFVNYYFFGVWWEKIY